jgi:hypothetical protein
MSSVVPKALAAQWCKSWAGRSPWGISLRAQGAPEEGGHVCQLGGGRVAALAGEGTQRADAIPGQLDPSHREVEMHPGDGVSLSLLTWAIVLRYTVVL